MFPRRSFDPGERVLTTRNELGAVLDPDGYAAARRSLREGKRSGRYFAPGCCAKPDYITQIPVVFEDGTYDVMRSMNLKRVTPSDEGGEPRLREVLGRLAGAPSVAQPPHSKEV